MTSLIALFILQGYLDQTSKSVNIYCNFSQQEDYNTSSIL